MASSEHGAAGGAGGGSPSPAPPIAAAPPGQADEAVPRVIATAAALALIDRLRAVHGPLMFHQSGGCCDGSAPMCYPDGEFRVGDQDLLLGEIGGCRFWMWADQYAFFDASQLVIDVVPGRGAGFSLESPEGVRFLTRSRLFTDRELATLAGQPPTAP